ncbi:MAG: MFS transporter [Dehalococcoidia bacterium]|nr:MFS transporter [Dehalococcoidia bacterium]
MAHGAAATPGRTPGAGAKPPIPRIIKRNTILVAASQVCSGMGTGLLPTLGALMVYRMLGSTAMAGSAAVLQGISRFVVAYPAGAIADRHGRKPAMVAGLLVGIAGALVTGTAMAISSFPLLMLGVFIFAIAMGGSMQLRVAATDMYPASRRAEGLGYILTGSVVGSLGKAGLIALASVLAVRLGVDEFALAWWMVPIVLVPALLLVLQIHPDPRDIALDIEKYWGSGAGSPAGHRHATTGAERRSGVTQPASPDTPTRGGFLAYVKDFRKLAIFMAHFGVQGNMSMVMVVAALLLTHHGHDLPAIAFSSMLHSLGMHAFAIPQGWLADRFGRRPVILAGLVLAAGGTILLVATPDFWVTTAGFFFVGFGWSAVHVAGTVLLADISAATERARVIGANDTFAAAANIVMAILAGPVLEGLGTTPIMALGVGLMLAPIVMILRMREVGHADARG